VDLDALVQTILASRADHWQNVDAGGNTYLDSFSEGMRWTKEGEEIRWLEHDGHHTRVVCKPNVAIGMAWGMDREGGDGSFFEDWVEHFPDPAASAAWLDLLYNGQPVDRRLYVVVDGGRCKIPLPEQIFRGDLTSHEVRRFIPYPDYKLLALVNELSSGFDYEDYLDRSGLDVSRDP